MSMGGFCALVSSCHHDSVEGQAAAHHNSGQAAPAIPTPQQGFRKFTGISKANTSNNWKGHLSSF